MLKAVAAPVTFNRLVAKTMLRGAGVNFDPDSSHSYRSATGPIQSFGNQQQCSIADGQRAVAKSGRIVPG